MRPAVLFCQDPLDHKAIEPDFIPEVGAAKANGLAVFHFNYDDLISGKPGFLSRIAVPAEVQTLIYRGWMLTPGQYAQLYYELLSRNYRLINDPVQYRNCHYLPDSLRFIQEHTPATVFEQYTGEASIEILLEKAARFGTTPVIVKDYVKSEKHDWETACFVPNASDKTKLGETIRNLIALRGKYLNEGIVIREFKEMKELATHSKSGMPLKEEYRLFFLHKKLVGMFDYWEEGDYAGIRPDVKELELLADSIDSNFFTMDIGCTKRGEVIIIELGDGQVSGLPENSDVNTFYSKLSMLG